MQPLDLFAARDDRDLGIGQPGRRRQNPPLFLRRRILDHDVEHEAIELRLGQRVCALLLDRVLGGQYEEWPLEVEPDTVDRDLVLLHDLEQGGLRLWWRSIDLVGQDDVGEDRPLDEADDALARGPVLFNHLRAEDVGRHQVRRELNAIEAQIDRLGQLLDEERLGQAGNAAKQTVPAGEKRHQNLAHDALLPDDRFRQLALEPAGDLSDTLERNGRFLGIRETKGAIRHFDW